MFGHKKARKTRLCCWGICGQSVHFYIVTRQTGPLQWAIWVSHVSTSIQTWRLCGILPSHIRALYELTEMQDSMQHCSIPHCFAFFLWKKCVNILLRKANNDSKMGFIQEGNVREILVSTLIDYWIPCVSLFHLSA